MQEFKDQRLSEDAPEVVKLTGQILELCNGYTVNEVAQAWYCVFALGDVTGFSVETAKRFVIDNPALSELVGKFRGLYGGHAREEINLALNEVYQIIMMNGVFFRDSILEDAPFSASEFYEDSPRTAELANKMLELCDGYTHAEIEQAASSVVELTGRKGVFFQTGASR